MNKTKIYDSKTRELVAEKKDGKWVWAKDIKEHDDLHLHIDDWSILLKEADEAINMLKTKKNESTKSK